MKLAVIGKDVSRSDSPAIHTFILGRMGIPCTYDKVSIPPERFSACAEALFSDYDAFNVTIPFKGEIMPYLREIRGDARIFGSVNTVLVRERIGYNTDGYGFLMMLDGAGIKADKHTRVLILGAGGAGRSCIGKLLGIGADVSVYEKNTERLSAVQREFTAMHPLAEIPAAHYDLIVNCTGIGMHDTVGKTPTVRFGGKEAPLDGRLLSYCDAAVDLIYVPRESEFLRIARSIGKRTESGGAMLFYQAYYADALFIGRQPDADEAQRLYRIYTEGTT